MRVSSRDVIRLSSAPSSSLSPSHPESPLPLHALLAEILALASSVSHSLSISVSEELSLSLSLSLFPRQSLYLFSLVSLSALLRLTFHKFSCFKGRGTFVAW